MDKQDILNHIEDFKAEQLFEFINQGDVTLDELRKTGELDASMRQAIVRLQTECDLEDDNKWVNVRNTEQGCNEYLVQYPAGRHVIEARQKLADYQEDNIWANLRNTEQGCNEYISQFPSGRYVFEAKQILTDFVEKRKILEKVRSNPNSYTPGMIKGYLKDGTISRDDLLNSKIPEKVIDTLDNIISHNLKLGETPESIPDGYTEVYFWGIPGSGKTCVLSAILSTAHQKGYLQIAQGPGLGYTTKLKNIFNESIAFLPPATPFADTQYLPFVLKKEKEDPRSASLIELSGEIFKSFYEKSAGNELSPQKQEALNTIIGFLNGNNKKLHFFFIDYETENKLDVHGLTQSDYLEAAARYFQDNNIFKKSTDAIYIVITKSDLMPGDKGQRLDNLKEYLRDANFTSFVNSLKARCQEHSINSGKILATNFSLGHVYFKQICSFDSETSENIIDILIRRIKPDSKSILDVFNN